MYNVFGQIKSSFAVYSALIITLITRVKAHNCSLQQFQHCMSTLENVTDSGLTFATNKSELDKVCPDLKKSVRCIHHFTRSCWTFDRHRHFDKMFRSTARMVHELCSNEQYQAEYLRHSSCMSTASSKHGECLQAYTNVMDGLQSSDSEAPLDTPISKKRREVSDIRIKSVCCAFQRYVGCSSDAMKEKCGEATAAFSGEFIRNMSSTLITDYCKKYGPEECGYEFSSATVTTSSLISLALLSVIALFLS